MSFLLELFKRPRFIAAISAVILVLLEKVGLDVSESTINELLGITAAVLAGFEAKATSTARKERVDDARRD